MYGTCKKELQRINKAGKIPIIECDTYGAININKTGLEGNYLFIYPPSFEELRKRIELAITEIEQANNSVLFTNRLVNDNLEKAVDQFFTLVESQYFQEIENFKKYGQLEAPVDDEAEQKAA